MRQYYVYILASRSRTLYVGVTRNLVRRILQHRKGKDGFTSRYRIQRLVYYDVTTDVRAAIAREKQVKNWSRKKKMALVASLNPAWNDLAEQLRIPR
ncbi:MAG TPA: GIY-YIG nuclease family protein [Gemmatimonadaceae bacterium]|nr:GIY-YIG nuclease family protein [Gemmatimonadaceae bacterium]